MYIRWLADLQAALAFLVCDESTSIFQITIELMELTLAFGCHGITKDKDREEILRIHNEYRANLTKGATVIDPNSKKKQDLPAAKNMYELEWDCDLEAKAEDAMNMTCTQAARGKYSTYGHARGLWHLCITYNKPVEEYGVKGVLEKWWIEGVSFDIIERRFDNYHAENFVNIECCQRFGARHARRFHSKSQENDQTGWFRTYFLQRQK
ncbi:hypothetical protein ANCCEY_07679 [Ancylostoma ceylanicum]|uniref:SCP domain-containing protein n=1 Tax=Ancylostoma ceylanicum TaxID=53326 RepID=A0A0D6LPT2_9BILA|nr:hypothetical protein ANCCEY_07679 [Ancylostoma ceylanicum]